MTTAGVVLVVLFAVLVFYVFRHIILAELGGHGVVNFEEDEDA